MDLGGAFRYSTGFGAIEEALISNGGRNSGVLSISDSGRRVPAEYGQESHASSPSAEILESKKIKNSGLPESKVQNQSVSSHAILTVPKSQTILTSGIPLFFREKRYPQTSSLHPQPDSPASEMSVLWLNAVGPVLTPQPG